MPCASFSKKNFLQGFPTIFVSFWLILAHYRYIKCLKNGKNGSLFWNPSFFLETKSFFGKKLFFWDFLDFLGFFFFFLNFFFFFGTARHCPALPAAMFGRHCQPPFLVRHWYLRRFNIREGGRTVATGIVTQGQCVVELWKKKKQKWRGELNPGPSITEASAPRIGVYTEIAITSSIFICTRAITPSSQPNLIL